MLSGRGNDKHFQNYHRVVNRASSSGLAAQIEVTFEEGGRHLGVETQRQWSDKAIERTTPALSGLFSIIALCSESLWQRKRLGWRQAAWYEKEAATFSAAIAAVRRLIWSQESFQTSVLEAEMIKIPRPLSERLTEWI